MYFCHQLFTVCFPVRSSPPPAINVLLVVSHHRHWDLEVTVKLALSISTALYPYWAHRQEGNLYMNVCFLQCIKFMCSQNISSINIFDDCETVSLIPGWHKFPYPRNTDHPTPTSWVLPLWECPTLPSLCNTEDGTWIFQHTRPAYELQISTPIFRRFWMSVKFVKGFHTL